MGANFTPGMVGFVIRLSANGLKPPSSLILGNALAFETYITAGVLATQVRIADPLDATDSGAAFTVSDMIDIEQGAMLNAYLRCVEMHLDMNLMWKDKPSAAKQYLVALAEARSAGSRSFTGRSVNQHGPLRRRLRDMPIDLTQTY